MVALACCLTLEPSTQVEAVREREGGHPPCCARRGGCEPTGGHRPQVRPFGAAASKESEKGEKFVGGLPARKVAQSPGRQGERAMQTGGATGKGGEHSRTSFQRSQAFHEKTRSQRIILFSTASSSASRSASSSSSIWPVMAYWAWCPGSCLEEGRRWTVAAAELEAARGACGDMASTQAAVCDPEEVGLIAVRGSRQGGSGCLPGSKGRRDE
jgi:hypothetical protein